MKHPDPHHPHAGAAVFTLGDVSRIFTTSFASVYPLYVTKVQKKDARRSSWTR